MWEHLWVHAHRAKLTRGFAPDCAGATFSRSQPSENHAQFTPGSCDHLLLKWDFEIAAGWRLEQPARVSGGAAGRGAVGESGGAFERGTGITRNEEGLRQLGL